MQNFLFLGCGKMGSIIARNLIKESGVLPSQIKAIKQTNKNKISKICYLKNAKNLPKNYQVDIVFIAIKPQDAEQILKEFATQKIFHKKTIFISILAGKKIEFFEKIFGEKAKIIRSMPNLAIQYSQGIFAYFCNKNIAKTENKKLAKIFEKFGSAFEIESEKLFDAITAIFGSGPAYIFLLQEIFAEIAILSGIDKEKAASLTKKLFFGSSLMSESATQNFSDLRSSVTSKNGTTEAALKILQKNSVLKNVFKKAISAAQKKSIELAKL
jgi:pyrroline-5-carboxylate reductase